MRPRAPGWEVAAGPGPEIPPSGFHDIWQLRSRFGNERATASRIASWSDPTTSCDGRGHLSRTRSLTSDSAGQRMECLFQ